MPVKFSRVASMALLRCLSQCQCGHAISCADRGIGVHLDFIVSRRRGSRRLPLSPLSPLYRSAPALLVAALDY